MMNPPLFRNSTGRDDRMANATSDPGAFARQKARALAAYLASPSGSGAQTPPAKGDLLRAHGTAGVSLMCPCDQRRRAAADLYAETRQDRAARDDGDNPF